MHGRRLGPGSDRMWGLRRPGGVGSEQGDQHHAAGAGVGGRREARSLLLRELDVVAAAVTAGLDVDLSLRTAERVGVHITGDSLAP